jgi:hypothetical protein
VLAFSEIIDFLLRLLSDEKARAEFEQDPQGALDRAGLEGVTADDVRDARLQLADSGAVSATDDGAGSSYTRGDDPIREINYTTQHYVAESPESVGQPSEVLTIDDRDTFIQTFISDDDTTINAEDSFNTEIDAENSFNESDVVTAVQDNDVVNEDNDVLVVDGEDADEDADDPGDVLDQPIPVEGPNDPGDGSGADPDGVLDQPIPVEGPNDPGDGSTLDGELEQPLPADEPAETPVEELDTPDVDPTEIDTDEPAADDVSAAVI